MAGTYGAAGTNPYTITGIGGILSNEVNAETGVTQVYRGDALTTQKSIGTYNPSTGKFTPDSNANLTDAEKKALSSPEGTKIITNASIQTAQKAGAPNAQQLLSPNSASTTEAPDQQGGTPSAPQLPGPGEQPQTAELTNISVAGDAGLRYPKLMKDEQDKIKFQACKIKPRGAAATTGSTFSFPSPEYETVDGPVVLAIQSPISDQNSVDWGPDSMNAIDAFVYKQSRQLMTENPNKVVEQTTEGILKAFGSNKERILNYLAGQAAGLNNVLARTDNVVLNPNLELLFQGPQLRPFSFTFKMSARSQDEAKEIKSIIKYFKYHMAVRKETGLFLRAPHVFTIRYLKGETDNHPGINLISPTNDTKACALTNCSVDYTPLGSYATYEDGTMVAYTLSLQFQELTPIYDTDYTDAQSIGY